MPQAVPASTTRRALMGTTLALPAVIATPVQAEEQIAPQQAARRAFIEKVAYCHPRGRLVATHAMSMGLDPDWCVCIGVSELADPGRAPALYFRPPHRAGVEVVVNARGAFEHGAVI